jgi:hypothetical protein
LAFFKACCTCGVQLNFESKTIPSTLIVDLDVTFVLLIMTSTGRVSFTLRPEFLILLWDNFLSYLKNSKKNLKIPVHFYMLKTNLRINKSQLSQKRATLSIIQPSYPFGNTKVQTSCIKFAYFFSTRYQFVNCTMVHTHFNIFIIFDRHKYFIPYCIRCSVTGVNCKDIMCEQLKQINERMKTIFLEQWHRTSETILLL